MIRDAVELTRRLVRMNTVNPPGEEAPCARYLGSLLEESGFAVAHHELSPGRANLVATIGGSADAPPLCFTGHVDTVPLGAAPWRRDPFSGETDAGWLHGRGSTDMKSGLAAFVVAACRLAPRLGASPGLEIVVTAGEETGCEGAFDLVRRKGALGRVGAMVVGEPTANAPLVGHKGVLWLTARTRGTTAHASVPEQGDNAIYKAARAVSALEAFRFGEAPHPVMGAATLNVGTIAGGLNVNSVPDEARIGIDIRTTPCQRHAAVTEAVRRSLGEDVELAANLDLEGVYTEPGNAWVQEVFDVAEALFGTRPEPGVATYFTDAAALERGYGKVPTVILGPGEPERAHRTDESCRIDRIEQATALYEEIVRRWCRL